jgi:uncharacterized protein (DUF1786 family)
LADFDFVSISAAFKQFGVTLDDLDGLAVAVFDHGDAPPDVSDRQFRFDYLDERIRAANQLSAFAYRAEQIPPGMTRLQAVAQSARASLAAELPLVVMDTAPAAVLGATFDPPVRARRNVIIANVGNFHTLAFRLGDSGIEGVFEHHTGLLDQPALEKLLAALADGSLKHADVFEHHGHGALLYTSEALPFPPEADFDIVVTGPRRSLLRGARLRPYFAVPFGDMMLAGCFGLLAAAADLLPEAAAAIRHSLHGALGSAQAPWEIQ